MAPVVTMRQLLDAGVHFGHQTRRWNPKMQRFIFGERDGIYIIDLHQTLAHIESAYCYVRDLVARGGQVLFVGTKKQAQDSVQSYAERVGMPYINERWLGGLLTNFETISKRTGKMKEFQRMRSSGELDVMPKKEALLISRELAKLERNLSGIRDLTRPPDAVFVLDTKKEHIAVAEANKLKLPVIAVVDTNCDPDEIQYVIPGNDDAIRSGELMCRVISEAVIEGRYMARGNQSVAPPKQDVPSTETELSDTPVTAQTGPVVTAEDSSELNVQIATETSVVTAEEQATVEPKIVADTQYEADVQAASEVDSEVATQTEVTAQAEAATHAEAETQLEPSAVVADESSADIKPVTAGEEPEERSEPLASVADESFVETKPVTAGEEPEERSEPSAVVADESFVETKPEEQV